MRLSRWGRSPYETNEDMVLEAEALGALVEVVPEGSDAEIVVVHSKIPMGPDEHGRAPSLRLLLTTTSGVDHIDRAHFASRGVQVARLPEARRDAVVDATVGMLIWGLRGMGEHQAAASRGQWVRSQLPDLAPVGVRGAKIGVVGCGVIGRAVIGVLEAFGAEVWGADPRGLPESVTVATVDEMLGHCDALTLHCDLNPTSRMLVDQDKIGRAHPGLVMVNTARGALLDTQAAADAVAQGRLGALCADVFPVEPWPGMAFHHPRVMFTPHAAGFHLGLAQSVREGLQNAVGAFVAGRTVPHLC